MKNHKEVFEALLAGETLVNHTMNVVTIEVTLDKNGYLIGDSLLDIHLPHVWSIKPKFITINGHKVPEPLRTPPKLDERYYLADPIAINLYGSYIWKDQDSEQVWLRKGLIHLKEESAIAHAKAILSLVSGSTDDQK